MALRGARTPEAEERLFARLTALASIGWEVREGEIRAYFEEAGADPEAPIRLHFPDLAVESSWIGEEAWAEAHRAYFPPSRVGPFVVAPPWNIPVSRGEMNLLVIDPGLAFGTGAHPTTRAMLALAGRYAGPDRRGLDVGTGSGILALAMARRGASVVALDVAEDSIREAAKTFEAHAVAVDLRHGSLDRLDDGSRFDLILANLTAESLLEMAFLLPPLLTPGGVLGLAGILAAEEEKIRRAFEKRLSLEAIFREGEWVAFEFHAAIAAAGRP